MPTTVHPSISLVFLSPKTAQQTHEDSSDIPC